MSSSSRVVSVIAVTVFARPLSLVVLRELGRVRIGLREIREGAAGWSAGVVDPVANGRSLSCVDHLCEERVDHVVVEGPSPARRVCFAVEGGQLDLEIGTLLDVRLRDVDDE